MAVLIRLLIVGGIVFAVYRILYPASPIAVTMTCQGVSRCKGLSDCQKKKVIEFAQEQLLEGETIKVKGYRGNRGAIHWEFPQGANRALAQRFRNFMAI